MSLEPRPRIVLVAGSWLCIMMMRSKQANKTDRLFGYLTCVMRNKIMSDRKPFISVTVYIICANYGVGPLSPSRLDKTRKSLFILKESKSQGKHEFLVP